MDAQQTQSRNGATPMPLSRDDQFIDALKNITSIMQQNRAEILTRAEYERRHEELGRDLERRNLDTRERLMELSTRLQRQEDNLTKVEDDMQKQINESVRQAFQQSLIGQENTISRQWAVLMVILSVVLSGGLGILGTLLIAK